MSSKKPSVDKRFEKFRLDLIADARKLLEEKEDPIDLKRKWISLTFDNLMGNGKVSDNVQAVSLMQGEDNPDVVHLTYILPAMNESNECFVPEDHTEETLEHVELSQLSVDELYSVLRNLEL